MSDRLTAEWVSSSQNLEDVVIDYSWFGGDDSNPTWEEYVARFYDEVHPVLEAIKEACIRDNLDLYGDDLEYGYFLLSNGKTFSLSMRAWGDFRQAMEGKREGYMKYYMRQTKGEKDER